MDFGTHISTTGYAVIERVLDQNAVDSLIKLLERTAVSRSRAGIRHLMADSNVAAFANDPRLLAVASDVLGAQAFAFRATLFDKSSDSNWKVTWHQDTALPLKERREVPGWGPWSIKENIHYAHATTAALEKIIALRIHLDDSTERNGPLRVIPATHNLGVLPDEEVALIASRSAGITTTASRGSVLAMRPLLIHASSKSDEGLARRVLHIEYVTSVILDGGLRLAIA